MPSVKVCLFVFCFFVVVVVVFWVFLAPLATMISACAIDGAIQRKMCDKGLLRAGKKGKNALVISNEDVDDIIRIIKSLHKQRGVFLGILVTFGASMLENMLTGKGVIRAGRDVLRARR